VSDERTLLRRVGLKICRSRFGGFIVHRPVAVGFTLAAILFGGLLGVVLQQQSEIRTLGEDTSDLLKQFRKQTLIRRDQSCREFEQDHLDEVEELRERYAYLRRVEEDERENTVTRIVLRGLPVIEARARRDTAPAYCDGPNIGLPEPDPRIPCRPPGLQLPPPDCPPP